MEHKPLGIGDLNPRRSDLLFRLLAMPPAAFDYVVAGLATAPLNAAAFTSAERAALDGLMQSAREYLKSLRSV